MEQLVRKDSQRLGVLVGQGELPEQVLERLHSQNKQIFPLFFQHITDARLKQNGKHIFRQVLFWSYLWGNWPCPRLYKHKVKTLVMVGKFPRPNFKELKVDFKGGLWLARLLTLPKGDDALLRFLSSQLEKEGFELKTLKILWIGH